MVVACTRLLRGTGYVAFDGELPEQPQHSALASEYAHVTAPLRRLVDRYAGEICVALCAGTEVPDWVPAALPELPETLRESAPRANHYENAVLDLVEAGVLADRVGETFDGVVVEVDEKDGASAAWCRPGPRRRGAGRVDRPAAARGRRPGAADGGRRRVAEGRVPAGALGVR